MKISVIGAGGVGGYFGARLAKAGHDVRFLARGAHLDAMRRDGLRIDSGVERFVLSPAGATDNPQDLAGSDVVLVTTKLWDLADTARQLAPVIGPEAVVIPLHNGVDAVDILASALARQQLAAGVAYISAVISEPGTIRHTGAMARLRVGALVASQEPTLRAFVEATSTAGFPCEFADDARRMLWEKFVALNALSAITAATRQPVGVVRADPDLRGPCERALREGIALGRALGVNLTPEFEAGSLKMLDALPADMRASMAHDLLAGRRLEAPWLCGAVVRRAAEAGVDVPVNAALWAALKPFVAGQGS